MTYQSCATFCSGYLYFGIEYSSQCFCGDSYANPTSLAPPSDCSMTCSGDATAVCGGPNRLNIFKANGSLPAASNPTIQGYAYAGCYTDSVGARVLAGKSFSGNAMTVENCAAFCQGYTYFGTEYGDECYCGNAFANPTSETPQSDCGFICAGNATELCGDGNRLSLYAATA
jgi:hypothetical protein